MTAVTLTEMGRPELDPPTTSAVATIVSATTLEEWWALLVELVEGHVLANLAWMRRLDQPAPPFSSLNLVTSDRGAVVIEGIGTALAIQLAPQMMTGDIPANCIDVAAYVCARHRLLDPATSWRVVFELSDANGHAFVVGESNSNRTIIDPLRS